MTDITELFCDIDDFCKVFLPIWHGQLLSCGERKHRRAGGLTISSKALFENLLGEELQLITKLKKKMKNHLIPLFDKIMLRKRALIETVNDQLKNICQIEHTRHRSVTNFMVNLVAQRCSAAIEMDAF